MKSLLTLTLLAGMAFAAQAPATTQKPKEEAKKADCCSGSMGCCASMQKDSKDAKKGGCCGGDAKEGSMCARKPIKENQAPPATPPKK